MPTVLKVVDRRVVLALLLVLGAASARPSSRALAASESGGAAGQSGQRASLKPAAATTPDIPFSDYDPASEQVLLDLANQARAQAGAPALTLDAGLCEAARRHAEAMFASRQLSHQFAGEPSLPQRLGNATHTNLDQEGENGALDMDAEDGHKHLMLSPPHRANFLNPDNNVIGLGVVRGGGPLYIPSAFAPPPPHFFAPQ